MQLAPILNIWDVLHLRPIHTWHAVLMTRSYRSPAMLCRQGFRMCLSHLIHTVRPCLIHTCHAPAMPFFSRPQHSTAVERRPCCAVALIITAWPEHGMGMAWQVWIRHGRTVWIKWERHILNPWRHGMAGERHGHGMLCVNRPLRWQCRRLNALRWVTNSIIVQKSDFLCEQLSVTYLLQAYLRSVFLLSTGCSSQYQCYCSCRVRSNGKDYGFGFELLAVNW